MTDQRGKILIFVAWIHIFLFYFYHTPEGKTTLKITRDIRGTPFNGVPLSPTHIIRVLQKCNNINRETGGHH
jgi:hypothetical protein